MSVFAEFMSKKFGWILLGLIVGFASGYVAKSCEKPAGVTR